MADLEKLRANLEARGFRTAYFPTADEAAAYLDGQIDGKTVGIGGSMTVKEMGLYPRLAAHNQVVWHWEGGALRDAVLTDVYITPPTRWRRLGRSSTSMATATGSPPPCTATRRSTSWWVSTRSPPTLRRHCGGPGTWPPPSGHSPWGAGPPAPPRQTGAMTARAQSASAGGLRFFGLVPMPQRRWKSY